MAAIKISDWSDIVPNYEKFKKSTNGYLRGACPKCKSRNGKTNNTDFSLNLDIGFARCKSSKCEYNEGIVLDTKNYKKPDVTKLKSIHQDWDMVQAKTKDGIVRNWLTERTRRGFSVEDMEASGVKPVSYFWGDDLINTALAYPMYDINGELINIHYRPPKKEYGFRFSGGAEMIFYGLETLSEFAGNDKPIPYIIITEGYDDALTYRKAGLKYVLSVPNGFGLKNGELSAPQLQYLNRELALLQRAKVVYLATDRDSPGELGAMELARRIGKRNCRRTYAPNIGETNPKDANEYLQKMVLAGEISEALKELANIEKYSKHIPVEGITDPAFDLEMVLIENSKPADYGRKITTFFDAYDFPLDSIFRFKVGKIGAILSRANEGKTPFWMNCAVRLAVQHGWKFGVYCPESGEAWKVTKELIQIYSGKVVGLNPTFGVGITDSEIVESAQFIQKHFIIIDEYSFEKGLSFNSIYELGRELVSQHGINQLIIDPVNNIEDAYAAKYGKTSSDALGSDLMGARRFCNETECGLIFVLHPSKASMSANKGLITSLLDANFGSIWESKVDWALCVRRLSGTAIYGRGEIGETTEVVVFKCKDGNMGRRDDTCILLFHIPTGRFGWSPTSLTSGRDHFASFLLNPSPQPMVSTIPNIHVPNFDVGANGVECPF